MEDYLGFDATLAFRSVGHSTDAFTMLGIFLSIFKTFFKIFLKYLLKYFIFSKIIIWLEFCPEMNDYTLISWDGDLTHNEHVKIFIKKSAIFRKSLFKKTCQIKIFAFFGEIYFHCTLFSMLGHSCTTLSNQQPKKISDLYQKFKIVRKNSLFT